MRWSVQDFRNKTDEELAVIAQSGGEGAEEELELLEAVDDGEGEL